MVELKSTVRRKGDLLAYDMDGETVMMSLEQGNYYALDSVGGRIWELIEHPVVVAELLEALQEEFEVEVEVCEKDTLDFLNQLLESEIIEVLDEAPE